MKILAAAMAFGLAMGSVAYADAPPSHYDITPLTKADVDLYLSTDLRTMTEVWMGYTAIARAKEAGRLTITGDRKLEAGLLASLSLSRFAKVTKLVA